MFRVVQTIYHNITYACWRYNPHFADAHRWLSRVLKERKEEFESLLAQLTCNSVLQKRMVFIIDHVIPVTRKLMLERQSPSKDLDS